MLVARQQHEGAGDEAEGDEDRAQQEPLAQEPRPRARPTVVDDHDESRVARWLKNAKLCLKKGKMFSFYYRNFSRLKKGQLLNKFLKISSPTDF